MYKLSYRNFLGLGIMSCAVWTFWFSWRYKLTTSRCDSECGNKAPNRNYKRKNKQNIIQLFKYIYNRLYGGEVEMYWIIWWKWWSFHLRVGLFYFKYKKQALINIYIYIYIRSRLQNQPVILLLIWMTEPFQVSQLTTFLVKVQEDGTEAAYV